jgi:arylsulfatase A
MGSGGNNYTRGILKKYALPETAPEAKGQLFDLATDPGETTNLYFKESAKREQMQTLLKELTRRGGRSAPRGRKPLGIKNIPVIGK